MENFNKRKRFKMRETDLVVPKNSPVGRFAEMLKRNNKQIRDDRAEAISEDCLVIFRRRVEDIQLNIKKKEIIYLLK